MIEPGMNMMTMLDDAREKIRSKAGLLPADAVESLLAGHCIDWRLLQNLHVDCVSQLRHIRRGGLCLHVA